MISIRAWLNAAAVSAYERTTLIVLLILIATLPLHIGPPTPDVSWLIQMCEDMLGGRIAYVDILETTPPIPTLLYMPAVLLGRLTGISSEAANIVIAYATGFLILQLTHQIISRNGLAAAPQLQMIPIAAAVSAFALSYDTFAQREFFAALFGLPLVAVFIRHAVLGDWPSFNTRVAAALAASLTVAIKPPLFALPGILIFCYYWHRRREISFIVASGFLAAALMALLITIVSFTAFPHYFDEILSIMQDVYIPAKHHPIAFFARPAAIATLLCLIIIVWSLFERGHSEEIMLILCSAVGFLIAYFVQGKFFPYQILPAFIFMSVAAAVAGYQMANFLQSEKSIGKTAIAISTIVTISFLSYLSLNGFRDSRPRPNNVAWMRTLDEPTVMAISPDIAAAFPLIRQFGGVWIYRTHSQWVARLSRQMLADPNLSPGDRDKLKAYYDGDIAHIASSIDAKKPDLIVIDILPRYSWLLSGILQLKPGLLSHYEVLSEEGRLRIMKRK